MYKKIILMLLLISSLSAMTVFAQSREEDSLALVDLYNSTDGDNWEDNTNWLDGPIDTWYGVTVSGGRVTELELLLNNLAGTIPSSIGNLTNLTYLDLENNQLSSGSIPTEVGNLTNLTELNLTGNKLTSSIPSSIGDLTELVVLRLCYNNLSGSIPSSIGNLTNLTTLYIRGRSIGSTLSGLIPSEIGDLTNLQYLNLNNNHLSGSIPSSIGNLTDLISLDLASNENLSGSIPSSIGNLTDLTNLYLNKNSLSGSIPSEIGDLTSLTDLDLRNNNFSGSIPSSIGDLTNLINLKFTDNQLISSIPPSIGDLSNLVVLSLSDNNLTGSPPSSIGNLSQLEELRLSDNQFTGSIPSSIGNLSQLRTMSILRNYLEDLPGLSGLSSLKFLEIQENKFTFEDIEPNVNVPSTFFSYSPQANVGEVQNEAITEGSNFAMSVSVGGEHNEYQWKKDGSIISGATNDSYTITSAEMGDAGSYTCEITNTVAIYLVLYSEPINVTVNPAPPQITITSPNGGEDWQIGSNHDITWTSNGTTGNVKIEYSTNNGSSWTEETASTTDDGSYSWTIPDEESTNCLMRVSDTDGDPTDVSDAAFTISSSPPPPELVVTSPNGGENWQIGSNYDITWTSNGTTGNVKIEYSINNGSSWTEEVASTTDDGSYSWTIPDEASTNCLVRISDTDGNPTDVSDAAFTISSTPPPPSITVTSPNGGEDWKVDSTYNVTWTSSNTSGDVKIEYSIDNGSVWTELIAILPDTGIYSWTIPDIPSDSCMVRISDTEGDPTDVSDSVFTISASSAVPEDKLPEIYSMSVKTLAVSNKFKVRYSIPEKTSITLGVYNINGTKIKEISEEKAPGTYTKEIDMDGSPAGAYFIKIEANGGKFAKSDKVLFVK